MRRGLVVLLVSGLFTYHLSLIAKNQTTNEDLKVSMSTRILGQNHARRG